MPLGLEVGLGPGDFVLDGDPARHSTPSPKKGWAEPPIFGPCLLWPNGCMIKMELGVEVGLGPDLIVLDKPSSPSPKGHSPQFSAHISCDQMAG